MKINKKIKSSIGSYIEQENIAYNNNQAYGRIENANIHLKAKEYYEKLSSDKFPILNDLNVTHVNYPDFKINNIVQTVKNLKNIIKDIIDYEDKNCECKSKDYTILKEILQRMQNDEMTKKMFNALQNIGVIAYYNPDQITFFENNEQKTYIFQLDNNRRYSENICNSNDNRVCC